jgi:hypothetical protein
LDKEKASLMQNNEMLKGVREGKEVNNGGKLLLGIACMVPHNTHLQCRCAHQESTGVKLHISHQILLKF